MREKEQNQVIDELLDAGLARYSDVAPRPGLEQRLLEAARAEREHRSRLVWTGALATGVVAAAAVLGVLAMRHRVAPPPPTTSVARNVAPPFRAARAGLPISSGQVPPGATARHAARAKAVHRAPEPRQALFPSPAPLSEQERLLLVCLKLPAKTQAEIFKKGPDVSEELVIKPLPPLAEDSEQVGPGLAPASSGTEGRAGRSEGGASPAPTN